MMCRFVYIQSIDKGFMMCLFVYIHSIDKGFRLTNHPTIGNYHGYLRVVLV